MTGMLPGESAAPLSGVDAARWQAAQAQILAVASAAADGTLDEETLAGGIAAASQVPLDIEKVLNAVHVPEDAGEHAAGLERILRRIPDGWGRWIGCDAGWYPLLVELDQKLAALLPEYEIHQVKEKYGTLRFYWGMPWREPACCMARAETDPRPLPGPVSGPLVPKDRTPAAQQMLDEWFARVQAHLFSSEHQEGSRTLEEGAEVERLAGAAAQAQELVNAAEAASARTCEQCGDGGEMRSRGGWLKTLCDACATQLGYLPEQEG
jgi:hypothetical protein